VWTRGKIVPLYPAGEDVAGLPSDIEAAYQEARECASVSAYTACELVCRKILMHVAVDKGAAEKLTFAKYLEHLANVGYVTPPMVKWVDRIRDRGNAATHELPRTSKEHGLDTLAFTAQLLKLIYKMDYKESLYSENQDTSTP
jgi:hypothetical protein